MATQVCIAKVRSKGEVGEIQGIFPVDREIYLHPCAMGQSWGYSDIVLLSCGQRVKIQQHVVVIIRTKMTVAELLGLTYPRLLVLDAFLVERRRNREEETPEEQEGRVKGLCIWEMGSMRTRVGSDSQDCVCPRQGAVAPCCSVNACPQRGCQAGLLGPGSASPAD